MTGRPIYVDSHAHLDDPQFDDDRDAVIDGALAAGVTTIVNIGYRPSVWTTTLALAERRQEIRYALGLHPSHTDEGSEAVMDELERLVVNRRPVAIGEIGIDLYWREDNLSVQVEWFERQIELAIRHDLPVVIHQRQASEAVAGVLAVAPSGLRVVLHSFDGSAELGRLAEERGWSIGVGGMMTRRLSDDLRKYLARIDLARVLLETDSPYLVPSGVKSRRNVPSAIPAIAERLAAITGRDRHEIASITTANARAFFNLDGTLPA